nr:MAG TPA: hypothetical protein [Caudoviricetes sp.]
MIKVGRLSKKFGLKVSSILQPPSPKNKPHARVQPGCMEILSWQNL